MRRPGVVNPTTGTYLDTCEMCWAGLYRNLTTSVYECNPCEEGEVSPLDRKNCTPKQTSFHDGALLLQPITDAVALPPIHPPI